MKGWLFFLGVIILHAMLILGDLQKGIPVGEKQVTEFVVMVALWMAAFWVLRLVFRGVAWVWRRVRVTGGSQDCPFCLKVIPLNESTCPYCNRDLDRPRQSYYPS